MQRGISGGKQVIKFASTSNRGQIAPRDQKVCLVPVFRVVRDAFTYFIAIANAGDKF